MIVKVQKKDEKSFPQNTHLDQSNTYTTLYKNYTQKAIPNYLKLLKHKPKVS